MPATETVFANKGRRLGLWLAPLIGPLAWFVDLQVSFSADRWSCDNSNTLPLHLATLGCLLLTLGGILYAWRDWREAGKEWPGEETGVIPRSRFMSFVALTVNIMFAVSIAAQAVPKVMLHPCQ